MFAFHGDDFIRLEAILPFAVARKFDFRRLDRGDRSLKLLLRAPKPVTTPNTMDNPALGLQDHTAQAIAVSRRTSATVRHAITLDGDEITVWLVGISHRDIDKQSGYANIAVHLIAALVKGFRHLRFEYGMSVPARRLCESHATGAGEMHEQFERENAFSCRCEILIDVLVGH